MCTLSTPHNTVQIFYPVDVRCVCAHCQRLIIRMKYFTQWMYVVYVHIVNASWYGWNILPSGCTLCMCTLSTPHNTDEIFYSVDIRCICARYQCCIIRGEYFYSVVKCFTQWIYVVYVHVVNVSIIRVKFKYIRRQCLHNKSESFYSVVKFCTQWWNSNTYVMNGQWRE